jgi:hypothetical protein
MFMIHMPTTFKVGDTDDCRINGESKRLTWRDKDTLVIEPDDARQILLSALDGELRCFMCGDAGADQEAKVTVTEGGFIVVKNDRDQTAPSSTLTPGRGRSR